MTNIVAVMQPYSFPYIGYFQLIKAVDTFVFYDDVNFIKRGWINRNKILINNQESLITFPCLKVSQNKEIREIEIDLINPAYQKILRSIELSYKKAPFFDEVYSLIKDIFELKCKNISEFNIASIGKVCEYLKVDTVFKKSSVEHSGSKDFERADRLIEITKNENSNFYINALGGSELYDKAYFKTKDVSLKFLKPILKEYKQFDNAFVSNLSIIDVLMFNSVEEVNIMLDDYELI